jgi:hypothetical protein
VEAVIVDQQEMVRVLPLEGLDRTAPRHCSILVLSLAAHIFDLEGHANQITMKGSMMRYDVLLPAWCAYATSCFKRIVRVGSSGPSAFSADTSSETQRSMCRDFLPKT